MKEAKKAFLDFSFSRDISFSLMDTTVVQLLRLLLSLIHKKFYRDFFITTVAMRPQVQF